MTTGPKIYWEIEPEEMPMLSGIGRPLGAEAKAITQLAPGKAIAFHCHWEHRVVNNSTQKKDGTHSTHEMCPGTNLAYVTARRVGFRIHTTCRDKTVYVQRRVQPLDSPLVYSEDVTTSPPL